MDLFYPLLPQPCAPCTHQMRESVSWIIREIKTDIVLFETFSKDLVIILTVLTVGKYEAVPILDYLQNLNREIREREDLKCLTN